MADDDRHLSAGHTRPLSRVLLVGIVVVVVLVGCSGSDPETVSCKVTLGDDSTTVTVATDDGTKSAATLKGYTVAFQVTGNGLNASLRNPDGSTLSDVRAGSTVAAGSAGTPDGELAFTCGNGAFLVTVP